MKKTLLLLLTLLLTHSIYSQKKRLLLYGFVKDSIGVVKNVNVFNLTSKQGTFTDDFGKYEIFVSEGDSLKFSSIQHKDLYRVVTNFTVERMFKDVYLQRGTLELDEIVLRNTILDGVLALDNKKAPKDKRMIQLRKNLDMSKLDLNQKGPDDHISTKVKPPQARSVDPTAMFAGAGAGVSVAWKNSAKLWALRRDLDYKENFPKLLREELGENFFKEQLQIPEEKYYHFLEYCNPLNIEDLYKTDKLKVIQILKKESKSYLDLQKNSTKKE